MAPVTMLPDLQQLPCYFNDIWSNIVDHDGDLYSGTSPSDTTKKKKTNSYHIKDKFEGTRSYQMQAVP